MAGSISAGSMLNVTGSMSTNTGVAPTLLIDSGVAKNVNGVVMTSSPGPIPSARKLITSASVPELTPIACFDAEVGRDLLLERLAPRARG